MEELKVFCRQVRARTIENKQAMHLVWLNNMPGQVLSIMRQELDSFVRVVYLLSIKDRDYRRHLISQSVNGVRWTAKDSRRKITDKEMVELADTLHGWVEHAYRFGCAFIHLSRFHDYQQRDPVDALTDKDNEEIREALSYYHGRDTERELSFADITFYLPMIFEKISSNLQYYLKQLENDRDLDEYRKSSPST
jgi:hypothetical protein